MMPHRVQRQRTKGWRAPDCTCGQGAPHKPIYVGRGSKWGNPHRVIHMPNTIPPGYYVETTSTSGESDTTYGPYQTKGAALARAATIYKNCPHCTTDLDTTPLRGHDLMCWSPPDHPCHADVLLEHANKGQP